MNKIDESISQAFQLHRQGDLQAADAQYRALIATAPDHPALNYLLGTLRYQIGDLTNAEILLRKSLEQDASNPQAHANLSLVLQDAGHLEDALEANASAIHLNPNDPEPYNNRAALLLRLEKYEEALSNIHNALKLVPDHRGALNNLGIAYKELKRLDEAEDAFRAALNVDAENIEALANLGALLCYQNRYRDALPLLEEVVSKAPGLLDATVNLGKALLKLNRPTEAAPYLERVLEVNPQQISALLCLSSTLRSEGRFAEAASQALKVLALEARNSDARSDLALSLVYADLFSAYEELEREEKKEDNNTLALVFSGGSSFAKQNDYLVAIEEYRSKLAKMPDHATLHWYLSVGLLLQGAFIEGFKEFDWRFHPDGPLGPHEFDKPEWDGRTLNNEKLLIHGEQGIGDIIQFMRYLPAVRRRCENVVFLDTGKAIYDLLGAAEDAEATDTKAVTDAAVSNNANTLVVEYDYQLPLLSLPKVFATTVDTVPWDGPYLHPSLKRIAKWKERIGKENFIRVGIVWAGNPDHKNDHNRSCRLSHFSALAKIPGIYWFTLQKGKPIKQAECPPAGMLLDVLDTDIKNLSDTMGAIANLDLVISVDTSVVHLAGAMDAPVWTLIPFNPDWRWMLERDDSPWYPSMRLFRQTGYSDWPSVFEKIEGALFEFVCERAERLEIDDQKRLRAYGLARNGSERESLAALAAMLENVDTANARVLEQAVDLGIKTDSAQTLLPLFAHASTNASLNGLARLLNHLGDHDKAFEVWRKAMHISDADLTTFLRCGEAFFNLKRYQESAEIYRQALKRWPAIGELHVQLARALQNTKEEESALSEYFAALEIDPGHPQALNNCAFMLIEKDELHQAELFLQHLLRSCPHDAKAWGNLARIFGLRKEHYLARIFFERGLEINPALPHLHIGRAAALRAVGRLEESVDEAMECIRIAPQRSDGYADLGSGLWAQGKLNEAIAACQKSIEIDPNYSNPHFTISLCHLALGDYQNGWREYEWRPIDKNDLAKKIVLPRWDGSPLNGRKLVVYAEQGLGDSIQFLRFLRLIKDDVVAFHCQNDLAQLVATSPLVGRVIDQDGLSPEVQNEFDVHFPLMSFPCLFNLGENDFGLPMPLFNINDDLIKHWQARFEKDSCLRIGFIWAGNPSHAMDKFRSAKLQDFLPLMKIEGTSFYSLQKGASTDQALAPLPGMKFINLALELNSFLDTAAAIMNLDLVITVDTAVAHLAGSLGKPVWTLIATKHDWRWLLDREDSPWYPTMRLFRQKNDGDWTEVMTRIAAELTDLVATFRK